MTELADLTITSTAINASGGGAVTDNPALEAWTECYGPGARYNTYDRHDWPTGAFDVRREVIKRYSFAIPTDAALDVIAAAGPVVEIGAGTGYWAELLRRRGCDVAAYDIQGEDHAKWFPHGLVGQVDVGGIEMAAKHPDRTLLLIWPYMDSMAHDAATAYAGAGGQRLVYIGEGPWGCTANDDFFALVGRDCDRDWDDEHDCSTHPAPAWREVADVAIPQWDGIHDHLYVYERVDNGHAIAPPKSGQNGREAQ